MGKLSSLLTRRVDAKARGMVTSNKTLRQARIEVSRAAASAGGISVGTFQQILRGDIECPPERRLTGFARSLNVSASSLRSAATSDGCTYGAAKEFGGEYGIQIVRLPAKKKRR